VEILISSGNWPPEEWVLGLYNDKNITKVHSWPTQENLDAVEVLLVWKPLPDGVVDRLPNLKFISSMGAGVDHLLGDPQIPVDIPVARIVDARLRVDMTNYVMMAVMMYQRQFNLQSANQKARQWERITYENKRVGVMGLGELGGNLASTLVTAGFDVSGYSRTSKSIEGVDCHTAKEQDQFLSNLDVLVNLLPVTGHTENILNKDLFSKLKRSCYLINVARGAHLNESDLVESLDSNQLSGAMLDVFKQEPLPSDHTFWSHPKITVTPHVASVTTPSSAMKLILENCRRLKANEELLHLVDLKRGY
jgi:glyoxylate/hydroxypyruvate reductase A